MLNRAKEPDVVEVGIRPNSSILSILSHLNYKAWYAVAEFVDNSIQSYVANRDKLRALHGDAFKLRIKVFLDQQNKLIEISDNAAGIKAADYPRAFRPAEVPIDRSGLSEFGMGMKTGACWFTHTWSVRSKALGENVERLVRFDLDEIINGRLEHLPVIETQASEDAHFTVLRLENLGKKFPINRTQKKLRDHLASIYRIYLRGDEVELYFNEDQEPLQFAEPDVLVAPPYNISNSLPVRWHKEIDFTISGNRRVHGFAAIRREASTTHAGFALFRRNRLILGSDDETYRPQEIFGNSNSFRYQRLFGELNFEGFDVSHTKDGFRWDGLEDELLQCLRDSLRDGLDLLRQADNYRARPSKVVLQPVLSRAGDAMAADLIKTGGSVLSSDETTSELVTIPAGMVTTEALVACESTFSLLVDNQKWDVIVRTSIDPALNEWVRIGKSETRQLDVLQIPNILVEVSMAHPFVMQFIGSRNENAELFLRFAVGLALAAEKSGRAGYSATLALHWFNRLLRESLSGSID